MTNGGTEETNVSPERMKSDQDANEQRSGPSWPRVIVLVVAFAWLAGAFGWFIADRPATPGSVDAGFCLDMIAHHEQAVEMALMELANGESPVVKGFAQEVVIFQQYEIGRMDEQLADWGMVRQDRGTTAMKWMGMAVPANAMPGMATQKQLTQLRESKGAAADGLFLDLMAEHHRGGVHMASYAAEHAKDAGVRALGAAMKRNQSIEINEYRDTVTRLGLDVEIEPYVSAETSGH